MSDDRAMPPLHGACHRGSSADAKKLLEMGEEVNEQSKSGLTPLMCACKTIGPRPGDDELVTLLLDSQADINARNLMGETALHVVSESLEPKNELLPKEFDKILAILLERNADVNAVDKIGLTPLHRACLRDNVPAIKKLMEVGADLQIFDRCGRCAADCVMDKSRLEMLAPPQTEATAEGEEADPPPS